MLTNFDESSIIDVLGGLECASEFNCIKSHENVTAEAIMKKIPGKIPQILLRDQNKNITISFGHLFRNYF